MIFAKQKYTPKQFTLLFIPPRVKTRGYNHLTPSGLYLFQKTKCLIMILQSKNACQNNSFYYLFHHELKPAVTNI